LRPRRNDRASIHGSHQGPRPCRAAATGRTHDRNWPPLHMREKLLRAGGHPHMTTASTASRRRAARRAPVVNTPKMAAVSSGPIVTRSMTIAEAANSRSLLILCLAGDGEPSGRRTRLPSRESPSPPFRGEREGPRRDASGRVRWAAPQTDWSAPLTLPSPPAGGGEGREAVAKGKFRQQKLSLNFLRTARAFSRE